MWIPRNPLTFSFRLIIVIVTQIFLCRAQNPSVLFCFSGFPFAFFNHLSAIAKWLYLRTNTESNTQNEKRCYIPVTNFFVENTPGSLRDNA